MPPVAAAAAAAASNLRTRIKDSRRTQTLSESLMLSPNHRSYGISKIVRLSGGGMLALKIHYTSLPIDEPVRTPEDEARLRHIGHVQQKC